MINLIIALVLFIVAVAAYAIADLDDHGKLRWESEKFLGFWGRGSDYRKYKLDPFDNGTILAPKNLYYRLSGVKYKEKWLTSATATVFLTDGWHLMQFVFINSLLFGFAILTLHPIIWFAVFRTIWAIVFNVSYKVFSKSTK